MQRAVHKHAARVAGRLGQLARAAFCAGIFCTAGSVSAQPTPLTLNWVRAEGAESCISGRELEQQLRRTLLAESVVSGALVIEGLATRDADSGLFRARLRVLDADENVVGMRELTSTEPSCARLTSSVVLVLSLLVELGSQHSQPARATRGVDGERIPALQTQNAPASAPARPTRHWQVEALAALALAVGLNPDANVGQTLGLRLRTPWWPAIALRAGYWPGGRVRLEDRDARPASVEFHTIAIDVALCLPIVQSEPWWFAGCWGPALALRKVRVHGLAEASDTLRVAPGASAALQFAYAVSPRWMISLDASLLGFRQRDRYAYEDTRGAVQGVFRSRHFAGLFALGLGVRL
jgi:hypothetical protein